ncbi:hypothetical protein ACFWY5_12135 [Nonomuraea sp. NPDC059007]|uniref:hypothetical protein n=1 Tax=Nonomuraea sp. NPDC059007 TaxID=3346692 RepID=UPI0036BDC168
MSKTTPEGGRTAGSRRWRVVAVIASVLLVASLMAGLVWFFADPLNLPPTLLEALDQRASVLAMFTGTTVGAAGLIVAVLALRAQTRAEPAPPDAGHVTPPQVSASGERSVAIGGANPGIIATGDNARNVQHRAQVSGPGRVYQAGGEQNVHEGDDHPRSYDGDHVELHHNTFTGKVVGKQVNTPTPPPPDRDGDEQP